VSEALAGELPQQIDVVTTRAVKLSGADLGALAGRLSSRGRFLLWSGRGAASVGSGARGALAGWPALRAGRAMKLFGSEQRHLVELFPDPSETT
jgi:hypothetical protein